MRIQTTRDLGLRIRDARRDRGLSQAELAERIGASRHWVILLERGETSAGLDLVLRALSAVGLWLDVRAEAARGAPAAEAADPLPSAAIDLGRIVDVARDSRTPLVPRKLRRSRGGGAS